MSTETITVACKMPHGLILRLYDEIEVDEPQPGGFTRTIKSYRQRHSAGEVRLKGYLNDRPRRKGEIPFAQESHYAMNPGVKLDFFEQWLKQNKMHPAVVNKLIIPIDLPAEAEEIVKDFEKTRSGFEPIDPDNIPDPRVTTLNTKA